MPKIIFYCQYVFGVGHLFRSVELVRALTEFFDVTLVVGGPEVPIRWPRGIHVVRLPGLFMDSQYRKLISADPSLSVAEAQKIRREILENLFAQLRPHIFIVELFPFGRNVFKFELIPLLTKIRAGDFGQPKGITRCVCSLRDVLVEKAQQESYEKRVLDRLHCYFDLLLVHADIRISRLDDTFSRVADISVPVVHTGFVAQKTERIDPIQRPMNAKRQVVASAGGGRSGFPLLMGVIDAFKILGPDYQAQLTVHTGPFMKQAQFDRLAAGAGANIVVDRFSETFLDDLNRADLSISMAGYNTSMNILATAVPALVWPFPGDREQGLRAGRLADAGALQVLQESDLEPARLAQLIDRTLGEQTHLRAAPMAMAHSAEAQAPIDLQGAVNSATWLKEWLDQPWTRTGAPP